MTHSRKILSQAGVSLADIYDIEGSVVGLEQLDVGEVKAVHELGATIHSERLMSFLVLATSGAVAQNASWGVQTSGLPDSVNRLLGVGVMCDNAARIENVSIAIGDQDSGREMPIWVWDTNDDRVQRFIWSQDGAGAAQVDHLSVLVTHLPQLLTRLGVRLRMPSLLFRGLATGFGAGTVETQVVYHLARPNPTLAPAPGEPSSHGLPIPSW